MGRQEHADDPVAYVGAFPPREVPRLGDDVLGPGRSRVSCRDEMGCAVLEQRGQLPVIPCTGRSERSTLVGDAVEWSAGGS